MAFSREQRRNLLGLFYGELTHPAAKLASARITSGSDVEASASGIHTISSSIESSSGVDAALIGTFVAQAEITTETEVIPFAVVLEGSGNNVTKAFMYYQRMRA